MSLRLKLSSPWVTYVNKLKALFENDPEIRIKYDNDAIAVRLYVDNSNKADAISRLLPPIKRIGNVVLTISVIPANGNSDLGNLNYQQLFDVAFENNPIYAFTKQVSGLYSSTITYVVFKNRVVQFFNDNLNDVHGLISTLYETIAEEIFEDAGLNGVCYNTDIEEKVFGMPLGEWP